MNNSLPFPSSLNLLADFSTSVEPTFHRHSKHVMRTSQIVYSLLLLAPISAFSFETSYSFNAPLLPENLTVVREGDHYSARLVEGALQLEKKAENLSREPQIRVETSFHITGDFTATVTVKRIAGIASTGLMAYQENGAQQNVYFIGGRVIYASWKGPGNNWLSQGGLPSSEVMLFRLRRVGSTLYSEFDTGGGFATLGSQTSANFSAPMKIGLFMVQEEYSTDEAKVQYDDLTIVSEGIENYTPAIPSIDVAPAIEIKWPSEVGKKYQVQWTDTLAPENWNDLGEALDGTGSVMNYFDSVVGSGRFYRIQIIEEGIDN